MGLFASRPEDPFEWAGIPSEPARAQTDAELLEEPPVDPFAIAPGPAGGSISISVDVVADEPGDPTPPAGSD
jgi:hypothetical protein